MSSLPILHVSKCFIKPKSKSEESNSRYYLTSWGLSLLSVEYIQIGLLFYKPKLFSIETFLRTLKESLANTLVYFYPLSGQLTTEINENRHESVVFVDSNKGPGAKFIYATSRATNVSDILSPTYVPLLVQSFFDLNGVVNHDGHTEPLLSVEVNELLNGIFIGVSMNHTVVDGTSYWNFWNTWSEIHEQISNGKQIFVSNPPIHNSSFSSAHNPLPFTHREEFISKYESPQFRNRVFHFSSATMRRLKEIVNEKNAVKNISSLQALMSLVWRSIVRAKCMSRDQVTNCGLAINNRYRLNPMLPKYYFRNAIDLITTNNTVKKLLEQSLGETALLLHQSVANHISSAIYGLLKKWQESPIIYKHDQISDMYSVVFTQSPRFDMYGNEFGLGKPVAVRSGYNNMTAGNVATYPGYEGGGSIDLQICLTPESMKSLEFDQEFMNFVSYEPTV